MRRTALSLSFAMITSAALAAGPAPLKVKVEGIDGPNAPIPTKHALCQPTPDGKSKGGSNIRPTIRWGGAPATTKSFAVVVTDPDVPASFDDASKDGKVVKADAKRQLFYHWALADIPVKVSEIEGDDSANAPGFGTPAKGSLGKYVDDATQYGGPCPPWNDERVHHYHFTVYALDTEKLDLPENPAAKDVEAAAAKHTLGKGSVVGTYTLNKALRE